MKRVIAGWVLIGLGVFLVVVAILANFWVPGQVQKTPKAVNTNTYLSGPADKLNLDTGKPESMQVKITVLTKTDSVRSTDDVDVWVQTVCVVQDTGNPPACLRSSDPRLIQ